MAAILYGFLEVAIPDSDGRPSKQRAFTKAIRSLLRITNAKLAGFKVDATEYDRVYSDQDNPCIVPGFGYSAQNDDAPPEQHGVARYFGVMVVVDGMPLPQEIHGQYDIDEGVVLVISSSSCHRQHQAERDIARRPF